MTPELISDLIKIGIPSLVALAGTASALIIARSANSHAQILERHRHGLTLARDQETRRSELLKLAVIDVTRLHHYLVAYGAILNAKQETMICRESWDEAELDLEGEARNELLGAFHRHMQAKAHILLLADDDLRGRHDDYLRYVSETLQLEIAPTLESSEGLEYLTVKSRDSFSHLIARLSELYLPNQRVIDET